MWWSFFFKRRRCSLSIIIFKFSHTSAIGGRGIKLVLFSDWCGFQIDLDSAREIIWRSALINVSALCEALLSKVLAKTSPICNDGETPACVRRSAVNPRKWEKKLDNRFSRWRLQLVTLLNDDISLDATAIWESTATKSTDSRLAPYWLSYLWFNTLCA